MRIVAAVDWSEQAFTAVQTALQLYTPDELMLVHAVDLRPFDNPVFAPVPSKTAVEELRQAMLEAGQQLFEQTATLVPSDVAHVRRVCSFGTPAQVILDASRTADLIAIGGRGRGRLAELTLGSVSHRVITHAPCTTLLVKHSNEALRRVMVAAEGKEDGDRLKKWLLAHPFKKRVDLTVLSAVPFLYIGEITTGQRYDLWEEAALIEAQGTAKGLAAELNGSHYTAAGQVFRGDPAEVIAREAAGYDLVVVGSRIRQGLDRFLLGSVSHAVTHSVSCPILIVR
jgi:nucleotide-binding universal stress UspA family protein